MNHIYRPADEYIEQAAVAIWSSVQEASSQQGFYEKCGYLGGRDLVTIVICLRSGIRLHPHEGLGYIKGDLSSQVKIGMVRQRNRVVEDIYRRVLSTLACRGLNAAQSVTRESKYPAVLLSVSVDELRRNLYQLRDLGAYDGDFNELEELSVEEYIVMTFAEHYSHDVLELF